MNVNKPFKIRSTGIYLPEKKVSSTELELEYQIPLGWSIKHSGVEERYYAEDTTGGEMGARAIENAIESCNLTLQDIDLLICTSATFDYPLPNQGVVIKAALKESQHLFFPAITVGSTCTGFVTGIEVAANLLDGVQYRNIIIVSTEISSKGINQDNWETATLFGDAAVAAIVSYDETGASGLVKGYSRTYSEGMAHTMIKGGGNAFPIKDYPYDKELHSFYMAGFPLLKLAKKYIPPFMDEFFSNQPIAIEEVNHILPHQASRTGLEIFKRLFDFKENQVLENLSKYGNCISASIPLLLHENLKSGRIKKGDSCLLCGTSAGFSIGAVLIKI